MTGDLPPGWARTALGSICRIEYGKSLSKRQRVEAGSVGVYGSAGLVGHHDQALVDEPVVIVGRKGNAGAVWYTEEPSWPIDTTYFLRVPSGICAKYLGMQLEHLDLVEYDSSTTIPSLRRPDLEATSVCFSPPAEQVRIVAAIEEHFSRLDTATAAITAAQARIEASRRSILAEAFSGRIVLQDPNDEPAAALLERIAADRQPARRPSPPTASTADPSRVTSDLPPSWVWATVAEVARVQLGRQRSPQQHTGEHMRPYLRAANVTWQGINLDDVKEMNFDHPDFAKYRLESGDILLNEASGSPHEVGKPAIWNNEIKDCCFQNTLLRLRPQRVNGTYLHWYCYAQASTGRFGEAGRGVNIRHLGKRGLAQFPIPVAPSAEQERIVAAIKEHFSRLDTATAAITAAQARIEASRRSILAEAFSGRLVPQDPNDEPATTLLERIAVSRRTAPARQEASA
ncbi:MAG: restriction endonuclease subunit S [Acidimicrobiaceae bacterium]|nr:restriction endonuclease subunit S [Acidimicrobiaceae bacterium]